MRRESPKVSGLVREYSRFAETFGGDGVRSRLPHDHGTMPGPILPRPLHELGICRLDCPRGNERRKVRALKAF